MADENLPHIVAEGLKDHLEKVELDCRIYKEAANTAKVETDKVKCDMLLQGIEFSRVENALKDELKSVRDDKNELRRKLHDKVQETIDLESKLVLLRKQVAELVEARKADEAQVSKLEKKSTEREVLLGKVEQDRDKAMKELGETAAELARAREENNELKEKVEELQLKAAQVLISGFGVALEQFAYKFLDLDLSEFSVYSEVVDGKIVPPTDPSL